MDNKLQLTSLFLLSIALRRLALTSQLKFLINAHLLALPISIPMTDRPKTRDLDLTITYAYFFFFYLLSEAMGLFMDYLRFEGGFGFGD